MCVFKGCSPKAKVIFFINLNFRVMKNENEKGNAIAKTEKGKSTPEEIKTVLQLQIEKFQKLQKIVFDRETFISKKVSIAEFQKAVKTEAKESADLETKVCKIILQDGEKYRDNNVLTISNRLVIDKFLTFVAAEIDIKVNDLEKQIVM